MWDQLIDILGVVLGIVFLFLNARAARTLVGSIFKRYHFWMMIASGLFALAFFTDFLAIRNGDVAFLDLTHHIVLFLAGIIFIATNLQLPKAASQYMNLQSKKGETAE